MQGKREYVLALVDKIFCSERQDNNLDKESKENYLERFPKTEECKLKYDITLLITDHLTLPQKKINHYFPNLEIQDHDLIRSPFVSSDTRNLSLVEEKELGEIKNN